MILALCTNGTLLIGLSARNIELLKQGKPIHRTDSKVMEHGLMIVYGETEQAIVEDLAKTGMFADDVVMHGVAAKP